MNAESDIGTSREVSSFKEREAVLKAFDFKTNSMVSLNAQKLSVDGRAPLRLGIRAASLMALLMQSALRVEGRFVTTWEIIENIDRKSFSELDVWRAINDLRRLLKKNGHQKQLIETSLEKGGGYRISTPRMNLHLEAAR